MTPLDPLKLIILINLEPFGAYWHLGDMLNSIVSNSHFGKRSAAGVMNYLASFFPPTLYFLIDEILLSRAPGHLQS